MDDFVEGHCYNKYESSNPIVKRMMAGFFRDLESLMERAGPKSVLDVGCAEGYLLERLDSSGEYRLAGIDLSERMTTLAKARVPDAEFRRADAASLPFQPGSFDMVLLVEVLEHLKNPMACLKEAERVSGRYVLASVPREPAWSLSNLARGRYWRRWGNTPGHVKKWGSKDFVGLLSKRFRVLEVRTPGLWTMALCERRVV